MPAVIVLAIVVPGVAGAAYLTLRNRLPRAAADARGIALQTVIIMVVLLAVAGAVAGVLLTRGGEAVSEVERQDITRDATEFNNSGLCEGYGFTWDGSCKTAAAAVVHAASSHLDQPSCESTAGGHTPHSWNADPDNDPITDDAVCQ